MALRRRTTGYLLLASLLVFGTNTQSVLAKTQELRLRRRLGNSYYGGNGANNNAQNYNSNNNAYNTYYNSYNGNANNNDDGTDDTNDDGNYNAQANNYYDDKAGDDNAAQGDDNAAQDDDDGAAQGDDGAAQGDDGKYAYRNGNGNYLWARDDDDDYYKARDDDAYVNYWKANSNLKAYGNNGDDDSTKYMGGKYVQYNDDAAHSYSSFDYGTNTNVKSKSKTDDDDDSNNGRGDMGLGLLSQGERIVLAVALTITMISVLVCFLFGPIVISSCYQAISGRRRNRKTANKDLATSLADLGDF